MTTTEELTPINFICPYCKISFKKQIELQKKENLFTILIKNHPNSDSCPPFIAFIDNNGRHRGSQKIDDIGKEISVNEQLLESSRNTINELEKTIRFYHLKMRKKDGRGFEHKIANVKDRVFMSSKIYQCLIDFLVETSNQSVFGILNFEGSDFFEAGNLIYGKYLGMIYSLFWKDQKVIPQKNVDDLKALANLTIEKLLDLYNLTDFFF